MKPIWVLGCVCTATLIFAGTAKSEPLSEFELGGMTVNAGHHGNWGINNTGTNNVGIGNGSANNKGLYNGNGNAGNGRSGENNTGAFNGNRNYAGEGDNAGSNNTGIFSGNDNGANEPPAEGTAVPYLPPPDTELEKELAVTNAGNGNTGAWNGNGNTGWLGGEAGNGNTGVSVGNDNYAYGYTTVEIEPERRRPIPTNGFGPIERDPTGDTPDWSISLSAEGEAGNGNTGFESGNGNSGSLGSAGNQNTGYGNGNDNMASSASVSLVVGYDRAYALLEQGEAGNGNVGAESGNKNVASTGDAGTNNTGFNNGNLNFGRGYSADSAYLEIFTGIAGSENIGAGLGNGYEASNPMPPNHDYQGSFQIGADIFSQPPQAAYVGTPTPVQPNLPPPTNTPNINPPALP